MKRGDIVIGVATGDYGKPRPCVVLQNERIMSSLHSVIVALVSSDIEKRGTVRIKLQPSAHNGLREPSVVMLDKIITLPRDKIRNRIGQLDNATVAEVDRILSLVLGLEG